MTKVTGWDEIKQLAREVRDSLKDAGAQASAEIKEQWVKVEPHVTKLEEKAMSAGDKFEEKAGGEVDHAVEKVKAFREQLRAKAATNAAAKKT
ncbi:MAG TPA: hypothetical protein VGM39_11365 [Kofleriaceae bacterium]|jgi:histidinol dehydrogenase